MAGFSDAALPSAVDLVFLHHSVGGQLLASPEDDPKRGGGLKRALEQNNYVVHEATYGSKIGEDTDLFHWLPKFERSMQDILRVDHQDTRLPEGRVNRVVMFKSCFPNNAFGAEGSEPGDPRGPDLTLANAKATLRALRPVFQKHPDTLFVYLTAPPLAPIPVKDPLWKAALKTAAGKPSQAERLTNGARIAVEFNRWASASDGWLADYELKNIIVFDLFGTLTDGRGLLAYPSGSGDDSHPTSAGNAKVRAALVPFLNRGVRRAGIVSP